MARDGWFGVRDLGLGQCRLGFRKHRNLLLDTGWQAPRAVAVPMRQFTTHQIKFSRIAEIAGNHIREIFERLVE